MINVNIIFSVDAPAPEQASMFQLFGQWVLLNERDGRLLFDAICSLESVDSTFVTLTQMDKSPVIIGGWNRDGSQVSNYPLNIAEWIRVAPDVTDNTDSDNPVIVRPVNFQETHGWSGWESKTIEN